MVRFPAGRVAVLVERELIDLELALEVAQGGIGSVERGLVEVVRHRDVWMERELRWRRRDGLAQRSRHESRLPDSRAEGDEHHR